MSQIFTGTQSAAAAAGKVLQIVSLEDSQAISSIIAIPSDDTPPLTTEGTQYTSKQVTPISASSKMIIEFTAWGNDEANTDMIVALFVAGTHEALAAGVMHGSANTFSGCQSIRAIYENNNLSPKTFTVRFGTITAGITVTMLGTSTDGHLFGSAGKALLTITEVQN